MTTASSPPTAASIRWSASRSKAGEGAGGGHPARRGRGRAGGAGPSRPPGPRRPSGHAGVTSSAGHRRDARATALSRSSRPSAPAARRRRTGAAVVTRTTPATPVPTISRSTGRRGAGEGSAPPEGRMPPVRSTSRWVASRPRGGGGPACRGARAGVLGGSGVARAGVVSAGGAGRSARSAGPAPGRRRDAWRSAAASRRCSPAASRSTCVGRRRAWSPMPDSSSGDPGTFRCPGRCTSPGQRAAPSGSSGRVRTADAVG